MKKPWLRDRLQAMTLWEMARNQTAVIEEFVSDLDRHYVQRLRDLGLREGEKVICLRYSLLGGPRVYQVGTSLVALEKELAVGVCVSTDLSSGALM